jgi:bifunctional enzyme CysN/CysC
LDANVKEEVERHDVAEVIFRADKAIAFDLATDIDITSRFVIVDQFEIAGGGIITESLSDDVSWARDKVQLRIEKWYSGYVSAVQRAERYNQRPTLILITGKKETDRKEYAAQLERRLFKDGKFVYYMSLGNFVYGVGGDIIAEEKGHNEEHFRRLAEFSNIMLATGQILIVSAQDVSEKELSIIKTSIDEDMIVSVWVGEGLPEESSYNMVYPEADARAFSIKTKEYLQKKGIIFSYNFDKI